MLLPIFGHDQLALSVYANAVARTIRIPIHKHQPSSKSLHVTIFGFVQYTHHKNQMSFDSKHQLELAVTLVIPARPHISVTVSATLNL